MRIIITVHTNIECIVSGEIAMARGKAKKTERKQPNLRELLLALLLLQDWQKQLVCAAMHQVGDGGACTAGEADSLGKAGVGDR